MSTSRGETDPMMNRSSKQRKIYGRCYQEFPDFPILEFDPAVFGFLRDVSSRRAPASCPAFETEDGNFCLWWNWPAPEEREWHTPMNRFFITEKKPRNDPSCDAMVRFATEDMHCLVRHLLVEKYAEPPPILSGNVTEAQANAWCRALHVAGLNLCPDQDPRTLIVAGKQVFTKNEAEALSVYVAAIRTKYSQQIYDFFINAQNDDCT